nr:GH25 family lysozyme [uncultured Blautia sp.]
MRKGKRWLAVTLMTALFGTAGIAAQTIEVSANAGNRSVNIGSVSPNQQEAPCVGDSSSKVSPKAWKKIDGVCYNGSGKKVEGAITRGTDVSEWQGKINWQAAKQDLDFAFVRISYGTRHLDDYYEYNMTEAEAAGVPVGTYVYSLAKTNKEALAEAQLAIRQMQGHKISYPVAFDLEDEKTLGTLSKKEVSQIALTFCDEIRKAGYTPILYMNLNWYNNYVDWDVLEGSGLDVWIASYGDTILAPNANNYKYTIWQCTAGDEVAGMIPTKKLIRGVPVENNVDLNFGYVDYTTRIVPRWYSQEGYTPATQPLYKDPKNNGWVTIKGKKYYYEDDVMVKGWKEIGGKYYCFSPSNGHMYKNKLIKMDGTAYYVDKNGVRVEGKLVTKGRNTYYLGSDGKALTGMRRINRKYYYFSPTSFAMQKNYKYVASSERIYYFGSKGYRIKNQFVTIKENGRKNTYYFGKSGRAYKGWHTIKGKKYYFYRGSGDGAGVRAQSVTLTSADGMVSVFDKYGVCIRQYKN